MPKHLQVGEREKVTDYTGIAMVGDLLIETHDNPKKMVYYVYWTACGIKVHGKSLIADKIGDVKCGNCERSEVYLNQI